MALVERNALNSMTSRLEPQCINPSSSEFDDDFADAFGDDAVLSADPIRVTLVRCGKLSGELLRIISAFGSSNFKGFLHG